MWLVAESNFQYSLNNELKQTSPAKQIENEWRMHNKLSKNLEEGEVTCKIPSHETEKGPIATVWAVFRAQM